MNYVKTFDIGIERASFGERDELGNPKKSFAPSEPLSIYAIEPKEQQEPAIQGSNSQGRNNAIKAKYDIFAPSGTRVSAYDRIILPHGATAEVIGGFQDWVQPGFIFSTGKGIGGIRFTAIEFKG